MAQKHHIQIIQIIQIIQKAEGRVKSVVEV